MTIFKKIVLIAGIVFLHGSFAFSQQKIKSTFSGRTHMLSPQEFNKMNEIGRNFYETDPPAGPVKDVAEFDKMEGVIIAYPYGFGIPLNLIKDMADDVVVTTIVPSQSDENSVTTMYSSAGVNLDNCNFIIAPVNSYWSRDYGPWFVIDGYDNVGITNFPYNRPRPDDNDIPIEVSDFLNVDLYGMNLISTGGNYMCDGYGMAASTTLILEENPSLNTSEVEQLVEDYLGITNYHITSDPLGEYIEHIDCWGKFLDVDKILIGAVPQSDYRYEDFENMASYWANSISSYGTNYQVFRAYSPNGQPYTNSLILNNKVFVPIVSGYGSEWNDSALSVYQQAMPGYEIIGMPEYSSAPWESTDALHCRTHGIADRNMIFIKHIPLQAQITKDEDYLISADITVCSDTTLYEDSVIINYSINDGNYQTATMVNVGGKTWEGYIPFQEPGVKVSYYLYAVDKNGQTATHPFMGSSDPNIFYAQEVNSIPQFISNPVTSAYINELYEYAIQVNDENGNDNLIIGYKTKPFWLSFSDNGSGNAVLSGTPAENNIGTFEIRLFSTDGIDTTYQSFFIDVNFTSVEHIVSNINAVFYPNPIKDKIFLRLSLEKPETIQINIFNMFGGLIKTYKPQTVAVGRALIPLNMSDINSGIYIAKLSINKVEITKRIVITN